MKGHVARYGILSYQDLGAIELQHLGISSGSENLLILCFWTAEPQEKTFSLF